MKHELNRLEMEKRNLQKELRHSESRATEMELQRMSLDGDFQRLQMMLQEKEAHIQVRSKHLRFYEMLVLVYKTHIYLYFRYVVIDGKTRNDS